jgi:uncharacterized protein involved in exopolysaccharide biosynthesis
MSGPIDEYLSRLAHELRQRGIDDVRLVEEAREHLVDAVEAGRERGASLDDATREAFERFGSPETIAAHAVSERDHMINRFAAAFETVWRRKWWILAPTVLTAVVTGVLSFYFLPPRYRSESMISIESTRVPADAAGSTTIDRPRARFQQLSRLILSRDSLEQIIQEFGLYQVERQSTPLGDLVLQMRSDINVDFLNSDDAKDSEAGAFYVSFVSSDPTLALRITARLTSLFVEENIRDRRDRGLLVEGTTQFIDTQIDDVRRRLIAYEQTLEDLRARNSPRSLSQADLLPYEVLQERYKALLIKSEESKIAANVERRQLGDQVRIVEAPRLPTRPVGPSRSGVTVMGTFAGLGLGLVFVRLRGSSKPTSA